MAWLAGNSRAAADSADYAPDNRGWNGVSELAALARADGVDLRISAKVDLATLGKRDGMLILFPSNVLPRADLTAFMLDGGRLAIADDFGSGGDLLDAFSIAHAPPPTQPEDRRLRGNRNVLVARPRMVHPLSESVSALVVNHAQTLSHPDLDAILGLGEDKGEGALVLAGAVGQGRLVALGDPSALINNMLEFRGNRRFARNLVSYLARDGKLWLVTPGTALVNHYPSVRALDPLAGLRARLAKLSEVRLPRAALQLGSAVIAGLLLFMALSALPKRKSYVRAVSLPNVETVAGLAGRVRFYAKPRRNLSGPILVYKLELERALVDALELPGQPSVREVVSALQNAGLRAPLPEQAAQLLRELDSLSLEQSSSEGTPQVSAAKLRATLATGDRILAAVAAARPSRPGAREPLGRS